MKKPLKVAITCGDSDGIGLEVAAKALAKVKPSKGVQYFLWRSQKQSPYETGLLDRHFHRITVRDWPSALAAKLDYHRTLIDIQSPLPPSRWVELMATCGMQKQIDALVTAPLSKRSIAESGLQDLGHTDILKRVCGTQDVFMLFLGKVFNVALLTDHVPLERVAPSLTGAKLKTLLSLLDSFRSNLPTRQRQKPLGVVGLNPHAGEGGLLGSAETEIFQAVIADCLKRKQLVEGPLVPDVCFQKKYWPHFACYVASYHDQGLIPFKMVHGERRGVQVSLGLPFLRISVDHGTAKDIFGKKKADAGSMEQALKLTNQLLNNKPIRW